MVVDLHTDQVQGFFDGPVDHLFAQPLLTDYISAKYGTEQLTVVSPDSGRVRTAERWANRLGGAPIAFIHKTRDPTKPNSVKANRVVGEVAGRTCVVVDDMIDTGGTIAKAVQEIMHAGRGEGRRRRDPRRAVRSRRRTAERLRRGRGGADQHPARSRRSTSSSS